MAGIFNNLIFNTSIFNTDIGAVVQTFKAGTGGIDPEEVRRPRIIKPTGLLHLPKKKPKEGRKEVSDRIDESRAIQAEIAGRLAREFSEETKALSHVPIEEMSLREIEAEIGVLLRKQFREKLKAEEDELLLLLLIAAV